MKEADTVLFITPWEREALRLVAGNRTATEVAACLGIAVAEVGTRLAELLSRMGASSPTDALARAWRLGLLEAPTAHPFRITGSTGRAATA
jgi:DNA-binding CsgD family transcriptional regulator